MTNRPEDELPSHDSLDLRGQFEEPVSQDADNDPPPWLGTTPAPAPKPVVGTTQTAKELDGSGALDTLSLNKIVMDRISTKSARDKSMEGVFGSWGLLSEEDRTKWSKAELDDAKNDESFWASVKSKHAELKKAGAERGGTWEPESILGDAARAVSEYGPFGLAGSALNSEIERKIATEHARARQRIRTAEEIAAGKKDAASQSAFRSATESFAQGVGDSVLAKAVQGVGEGWGYAKMAVGAAQKPTDNSIYAAGKWVEDKVKSFFPGDAPRQEEWGTKLGQGAGSMIGFLGPALGAKALTQAGPRALAAISGSLGAVSQAGNMFDDYTEDRLKKGLPVDERTRLLAYLAGYPIGATEAVPVEALFSRPGGAVVRSALIQMVEEGGQEFVQQVMENLTVKHLYDPDRNWDDNAWEGLAIGAILGAGMGGGTAAVGKMRGEGKPAAEKATPDIVQPKAPGASATPEVKAPTAGLATDFLEELRKTDPEFADAINRTQVAKVNTGTRTDVPADVQPMMDGSEPIPGEAGRTSVSTSTTPGTAPVIPEEIMAVLRASAPEIAAKFEAPQQQKPDTNISTTELMYGQRPGQEGSIEKLKETLAAYDEAGLRKIAEANGLEMTGDGRVVADLPFEALPDAIVSATARKHRNRTVTAQIDLPEVGVQTQPDELDIEVDEQLPALAADIDGYLEETGRADLMLSDSEYRLAARKVIDGVNIDDAVEQVISARAQPGIPTDQIEPDKEAAPKGAEIAESGDIVEQNQRLSGGAEPAVEADTDALYAEFVKILAGKLPSAQWPKALGVDQAQMDALVGRALVDGRLSDVGGKPRRTPKARVLPTAEPQQQQQETKAAPASAAKATPTLTRAEEKRLEAVKDNLAYAYAKRLLDTQGDAAQFDGVLQAIRTDKRINKEKLKQLFRAFSGSRSAPKTRPKAVELMRELRQQREDVANRKAANADTRGLRQGEGSIPEGSIPDGPGSDAGQGDVAGALGDGGAERLGDVAGSGSADGEPAGPTDGVPRESDGARADTGSGPGDRELGTDPSPPDLGLTAEQRAEIQARVDADADAYESKRQSRITDNYTITDADKIGQGGPKAKVRANLDAIRIIRQIEQEGGRPATPEEKAKLVKYVGWGAFAQDVFADYKSEWAKERAELKDLLSPEEYTAARASVTNAHYTSPDVIKGMWDALKHMGFEGGRVLEPSAGIGHFIGLQPESMKADSDWTAVELDKISGAITKALYGATDVRIGGFENQMWPDDHFDLAISNVPFAKQGPHDPRYKTKFSLHDYFFIKALDKVRPGGIVAFITSNFTLDKQRDTARREMEKRATFLGAIRLPGGSQGAFKANAGADVTTDIIFLRKRIEGEPVETGAPWTNLAEIKTPEGPTKINAYFAEKPDMMLGKMRLVGSMYARNTPVLIGPATDLDTKIVNAATDNIPAGSMIPRGIAAADIAREDLDTETDGIKEGAFYEKDGKLYRKVVGVGVPQKLNKQDSARVRAFMPIRDNINVLLQKQAAGDRPGMDDLRSDLGKAYDAFVKQFGPINLTTVSETTRKDGKVITTRRRPNFSPLMDDPDAYKVSAIEIYDEKSGKAIKAAIFSEDIVAPYQRPQLNDPADAIGVSLNEKGRIDLPTVASALGVSEAEAIAALGDKIFLNPKGERWQTRSQYLSGDVVTKLEEARAAAATDKRYARNVAALEDAQPVPLTRVEITIPMGSSWVPVDIYNDFIRDVVGARRMTVSLNEITKRWRVDPGAFPGADAVSNWGTDRVSVEDIVEAAFNSTPVMVWDKHHDGSRTRNEPAEAAARAKIQALREAFAGQVFPGSPAAVGGWVWKEEERAQRLEDGYNRALNRIVKESHDGAHLTFPGLARTVTFPDGSTGSINLTPARTAAVWRIIQNGNTLIDHVVGAGKTWTSIMAVMEMKRLGQIRRPMFVVPNHMLHQFSHEFLQAYPGAKLLIATKEGMSAARRKEFAAKAASEKWDGIIITHSAFGRLRMQDSAYEAFFRDQIDAMEEAKTQAALDEGKNSPTVKDLEKAKKSLQARLDKLVAKDKKDYGITFEELGVDHLTVDEAHLFKNLSFPTRHTRVRGISNKSESQRATDLFIKIQHLEQSRPGRSVLFLTGTPLSNTMAEVYTMMRYLMMPRLKEYGIAEFDSWAQTFGMIDTRSELSPDGKGYRDTTSFSTFVNVPELSTLYGTIADTQTAESLKLPRPTLKDGKATLVESDLAFDERAALERIFEEMAAMKGKKPEKGAPNFLSLFTRGMQVATDMRLVNPDAAFNPTGKIAKAINNIFRIWEQGNADPSAPNKAQIVFLDMGVPGSKAAATTRDASESAAPTGIEESEIDKIRRKMAEDGDLDTDEDVGDDKDEEAVEAEKLLLGKFNLYADIKNRLVSMGVPAEQIAFIHDAKTDEAKAKMFDAVREGKIRVLIGSTGKMGVGTNVQKRLVALHHIDAPWRPADLEQRDGRILRQGNKNSEVQIFRYITLRSLDAYKWQVLDTKSNFIGQFRAGARGVRIAEDIDMPLPDAAQVKAAATGDPRFQEQADLSRNLRQLEAQSAAHASTSIRARASLDRLTSMRDALAEKLPAIEADAERVTDLSGDNFKVTIDGDGDYTDRKKAGTAIRQSILDTAAGMWSSRSSEIKIGKISGFDMSAFVRRTQDGIAVTAEVRGDGHYESADFYVTEETNPVMLVQRFERLVREPARLLGETRGMLATIENDIPKLEKSAVATPFGKQAELVITRARLADIGAQLDPKKAEAKAEMVYVDQAMANLMKTSRTAAGVIDTSASAGKAEKMAEGLTADRAKAAATENVQRAMREAFAKRDQYGQMPVDRLSDEIDRLVIEINKGILKPGALYRTEDGHKYPYTGVSNLNEAHRQFVEEFKRRLSDPNADPVETAAWVEWRANLTDHFWADGVGKTSKVLAAIPLMKAGLPLPVYRDNKEMFAYSQPAPYVPNPDGSTYRDGYWERFLAYYRTLMPSTEQAALDNRERKAREIMASPEWTAATIPDMSRDTQKQPGFGTPEWREARTYNTPDGEIVGYENGIDYLIRSAHAKVEGGVKSERKVFLLLGMPGAGKSTIASKIGEKHGAVHYVGDDAKLIIPEYDGGNNSGGVHEEASDMMKDVIDRQTSSGVNIIVEKLGSSDGSIMKMVDKFARNGYKVVALNVDVPKSLAMERAIGRWQRTGRAVPINEFDKTALNLPGLMTRLAERENVDETGKVAFSEARDRWELASEPTVETEGLWDRAGATAGNPGVDGMDRGPGDARGPRGSSGEEGKGQVTPGLSSIQGAISPGQRPRIHVVRPAEIYSHDIERDARLAASKAFAAGNTVVMSPSVVNRTNEVLADLSASAPIGTGVGTLAKIRPLSNGRAEIVVRLTDGKLVNIVADGAVFAGNDASVRAFHVRLPRDAAATAGVDRLIAVVNYTDAALEGSKLVGLTGVYTHELVHALRQGQVFDEVVWNRLVDHAYRSGVMEMSFERLNEALGLPQTTDKRSISAFYHDFYMRQHRNEDVAMEYVDQEAVTHFAELAAHGYWTEAELAPVKDVLDAIQSGALVGRSNAEVAPGVRPGSWGEASPADVGAPSDHPTMRSPVLFAITVFHGSPHDFDRFSMDKIGTGEGAQAYGHGLYFAEAEDVARRYRDTLANFRSDHLARALIERGVSPETASAYAEFSAKTSGGGRAIDEFAKAISESAPTPYIQKYRDKIKSEMPTLTKALEVQPGHMYEVRINAAPEDFLDWDKPLSQQSEKVREVAAKNGITAGPQDAYIPLADAEWKALLRQRYGTDKLLEVPRDKWVEAHGLASRREVRNYDPRGQEVLEKMGGGDMNFAADLTPILRDAGIPGIRYLDQGSRGAGEGTYNYVVFDASLIEITAKNGEPVSKDDRQAILFAMSPGWTAPVEVPVDDKIANMEAVRDHIAGLPREETRSLTDDLDVVVSKSGNYLHYDVVKKGADLWGKNGDSNSLGSFIVKASQRMDALGVEVTNARLSEDYQRQGIGTKVYDMVSRDMASVGGLAPSPDEQLSDAAQSFWSKRLKQQINSILERTEDGTTDRTGRGVEGLDDQGRVPDGTGEGAAEGQSAAAGIPGSREEGADAGDVDFAALDWQEQVEAVKGRGWLDADAIAQRQRAQGFTTKGWHGTTADFDTPDPRYAVLDFGFHIAIGNPRAANYIVGTPSTLIDKLNQTIATGERPQMDDNASILPVVVRAENPLRMDDPGLWRKPRHWKRAIGKRKGPVYDALREVVADHAAKEVAWMTDAVKKGNLTDAELLAESARHVDAFLADLTRVLEKNDIDAIIYKNRIESLGRDSLFVWKAENVRSQFDLFDERAQDDAGLTASRKYLEKDLSDLIDGLIEETIETLPRGKSGLTSEQAFQAMLDPVSAPVLFAFGGRPQAESDRAALRDRFDETFAGRSAPSLNKIIVDLKETLGLVTTQGLWGVTVRQDTENADGSTTTRQKRIRPSKRMRAMFRPKAGVASLRMSRDISAIAHEGGHALEQKIGQPLADLKDAHRAALEPLAYAGATDQLSEGFAEWFKSYIVDREGARTSAPDFFDAFEDVVDAELPGTLAGLIEVQSAYAAHVKLSPDEALAADLVSTYENNSYRELAKDGSFENISGKLSTAYTNTVDATNPINKMVRKLLEVADANGVRDHEGKPISIAVHENPYKLARLFADSYARGRMWLENGISDLGSTVLKTKGMHDALTIALKTAKSRADRKALYAKFGAYLVSRRAIAEYDLLAQKKEDLAQIDATLAAADAARPMLADRAAKDRAILDRRRTALVREQTLLADRRRQLSSAQTQMENLQVRLSDLRDDRDLGNELADQSGVAGNMAVRRGRSLSVYNRDAVRLQREIDALDLEVEEREIGNAILANEVEQAAEASNSSSERLSRVDQIIDRAKKERARRAEMGASRPPTLQSKADHEERLARLEAKHPEFIAASKIVYDWTHQLLTVRRQAGFLTQEQYEFLSQRKGWYTPFQRDMTDLAPEAAFGGETGPKKWSPFKKFDGSDRAIINPLETLSQMAYTTGQQIAFNDIVVTLNKLATKVGKGGGQIVEALTQPESMERNQETFEKIKATAVSLGVDPVDAHLIVQSMEQNFSDADVQLIWSPENKGPMALPTLPMWVNGERILVRLTDPVFGREVFDAVNGLGKEASNLLDQIGGGFSTALRVGVTTHPDFVLGNLLRDIPAMFIVSGAVPGVAHARGLKHLFSNTEMVRLYNEAGGIMGGANVAATRKSDARVDVLSLTNKGFHVLDWKRPWHVVEAVETAGRLGVFAHAYKQAKAYNPNLTDFQAAQEAAYVARDVIDFGRRGSKSASMMRVVTFMNAHVQSMDKAARLLSAESDRGSVFRKQIALVLKAESGAPLSRQEERSKAEAYKAFVRLALYTAFLLAIYGAMKDDREYQALKDQTKNKHAWFKAFGTWFRLPTAFEWAMPATWAEIVMDKLAGRNEKMSARLAESAKDTLVPPILPQALNLGIGVVANYNTFTKRQIVDPELQKLDPSQQFDAYSSQLAIDMAKAIEATGMPRDKVPSPKMLDFLLTSGLAYWGKEAQNVYSAQQKIRGASNRESWQWTDLPVIRRVTGEPARQDRSIEEFFKMHAASGGELSSAARSYSNYIKKFGKPEEAAVYLSRLEPEERAYAYLMERGGPDEKRMHPLERLTAADGALRELRKDMILDRLTRKTAKGRRVFEEKLALSPDKQTEVHGILEKLGALEAWNTMVLLKRRGWENGQIYDPKPLEDTLRAASPEVYNLLDDRRTKAKMEPWSSVQKNWPAMRERLLRESAKPL